MSLIVSSGTTTGPGKTKPYIEGSSSNNTVLKSNIKGTKARKGISRKTPMLFHGNHFNNQKLN